MKKAVTFTILFAFLFTLLSFSVSAQYATITEEGRYYRVVIPVNKGWNLLPSDSFAWWDPLPDSESMFLSMKAMYLYLPVQNKYVDALGGFTQIEMDEASLNKDFLWTSAMWYYFDKKGEVFFRFPVELPREPFKLKQGWNLFTVPPHFDSDSGFGNLGFGNCDVTRAFMFDTENNKWFELESRDPNMPLKDLIVKEGEDFAGLSFAIKVAGNCQLDEVVDTTMPGVPQLPN
ncbi:hypothetical protein ACFL6I_21270 [candidate division KSB1 bacterium]